MASREIDRSTPGNLERPTPELTDAYNAANEGDQRCVRHPGAEALGDPLAEPLLFLVTPFGGAQRPDLSHYAVGAIVVLGALGTSFDPSAG